MRNFTSLVASVLLFCLSFAWAQSTITSTRTVVHVVTETHFHSTPVLETMNVTSVFVSTETPVATPSSGFKVPYSMNGTGIMTPTPAGMNAMTSLANANAVASTSASATPSTGAAVPLKIDAALAVLVAGVGYLVL